MRTGVEPLGAIIKSIHGNPGFSLRPRQLEHIRWWSRREQSAGTGIVWNKRDKQNQQSKNLRQVFVFHNYLLTIEHKRKASTRALRSKCKKDILSEANHIARL